MNASARLRRTAAMLVLLAAGVRVAPGVLVRAAYEERLAPRINDILSGRDVHPVEHYLELVAGPQDLLTIMLIAGALVLLGLERADVRARLTLVLTGGRTGTAALLRPAALLVLVIAAAVRLPALGATSLWLDEAMVAGVSTAGPDGLLSRMASNSSAGPLHHLVQMALFAATTPDATVARLPSAVAGLMTVALLIGLHRLGLPRSVALGSAFVVAVSPAHVGFSRDATQYAPAVLMAVLALSAGLAMVDAERRHQTRWRMLLVVAFALAPWFGYQVVLVGLAVLVALAVVLLSAAPDSRSATFRTVGLGAAPLLASSGLAYMLAARRQTGVLGQWYLVDGFPATSAMSWATWVLHSLDGFMAVVAGGQVTGRWSASGIEGLRQPLTEGSALGWLLLAGLVAGCLETVRRLTRAPMGRGDRSGTAFGVGDLAILAAAALVLGSMLAAALRLYPFGGMHQQLHATPIVLVGSAVALRRLLGRAPRPAVAPALLLATTLLLATALPAVPPVFAEREDIVSAVVVGVDGRADRGLDALGDRSVWVYRDARPAVRFHFPGRDFTLSAVGPTDLDGMREEILRIAEMGEVALVFSQIHPHPVHGDQRRALQALLLEDGWAVLEEIHHPNTVVLNVAALRSTP